jgi:hypothetical protein
MTMGNTEAGYGKSPSHLAKLGQAAMAPTPNFGC